MLDEIPCHVVSDPEVVYKKVAASPEMEEDKDCIIRDQKETIEVGLYQNVDRING